LVNIEFKPIFARERLQIEKLDNKINITTKKQIISMRNRVIHGYDKIDDAIIWGTIIKHLPILKNEIQDLID